MLSIISLPGATEKRRSFYFSANYRLYGPLFQVAKNLFWLYFALILVIYFLAISFASTAAEIRGQLVAVQMKLEINNFYSQDNFERKINSLMEEVVEESDPKLPTLVVFPDK